MYTGPPVDDPGILGLLPAELSDLLVRCNGYVAFHGGLHVRGACVAPTWHSLRYWWFGPRALHGQFPILQPSDIPFAEDAVGDQYILRGAVVHRLFAESGELTSLGVDLQGFDQKFREDPVGYLSLQPLEAFRAEGGSLKPGELLSVMPPFVMRESAEGVSYRAISTEDRICFLADFARQIADVPDGARIKLRVKP